MTPFEVTLQHELEEQFEAAVDQKSRPIDLARRMIEHNRTKRARR